MIMMMRIDDVSAHYTNLSFPLAELDCTHWPPPFSFPNREIGFQRSSARECVLISVEKRSVPAAEE